MPVIFLIHVSCAQFADAASVDAGPAHGQPRRRRNAPRHSPSERERRNGVA